MVDKYKEYYVPMPSDYVSTCTHVQKLVGINTNCSDTSCAKCLFRNSEDRTVEQGELYQEWLKSSHPTREKYISLAAKMLLS